METQTYYDILGLLPDASHRQVVKAFGALAERYQKHASDPIARDRFQLVKAAYQTLTNYELRLRYNMERGLPDPPRPGKAGESTGLLDQIGSMLPENWPVFLPWFSFVLVGTLAHYLLTGSLAWGFVSGTADYLVYAVGVVSIIGLAAVLSRNT